MTSSASTGDPRPRLAYDDLGTPAQMSADCRAAGANLRLERAARAAVSVPPSIHFEDYPREVAKRDRGGGFRHGHGPRWGNPLSSWA